MFGVIQWINLASNYRGSFGDMAVATRVTHNGHRGHLASQAMSQAMHGQTSSQATQGRRESDVESDVLAGNESRQILP